MRSFLLKHNSQAGAMQLFIIALIVGFAILLTGGFAVMPKPEKKKVEQGAPVIGIPQPNISGGAHANLQMKTFGFTTVTPSPSPSPTPSPSPASTTCALEGEIVNGCACGSIPNTIPPLQESICNIHDDNKCVYSQTCAACGWGCSKYITVQGQWILVNCPILHRDLSNGNDHCIGKPVIYLYPPIPMLVNVSLTIPGTIYESIPAYSENGWTDVFAQSNGTLRYQNQTYHELYYESQVGKIKQPDTGIVIPQVKLQEKLSEIITRLGLLPKEQDEFLSYWLPKLYALKSPYVLFSVIDQAEKERVDHVTISPQPDTWIAFLAYFKPLDFPVIVQPLTFPKIPERKGFTAVEWGGTIEQKFANFPSFQ